MGPTRLDNINPTSEANKARNEFSRNSDKAQINFDDLRISLDKYKSLKTTIGEIEKIYSDLLKDFQNPDVDYEEATKGFEKDILYLFQKIDYNDLDKEDWKNIKNQLANVIQSFYIVSNCRAILEELEELEDEDDPKEKKEILESINTLKGEIDGYKQINYKNEIINKLENNMKHGNNPNPGNNRNNHRPSVEDQIKIIEAKNKTDIEKAKALAEIKRQDLEHEHNLKNSKLDNSNQDKELINEIAEKIIAGIALDSDEEDFKSKNLRRIAKEKKKIEDNSKREDAIAEQLAKGTKVVKLKDDEKKFYEKNKKVIDDKVLLLKEDLDTDKEKLINTIALFIVEGRILSQNDKDRLKNKEFKDQVIEVAKKLIENNKIDQEKIREIALAEIDKITLTDEQILYGSIPDERVKIDQEKIRISHDRAKEDAIASKLADNPDGSTLSTTVGGERDFYNKNKDAIDAKIPLIKENRLKRAKLDLIDKIVAGGTLTPEEEKLDRDNYAEINPKVIEKLKAELALATTANDTVKIDELKKLIDSRIRLSEKSKDAYKPFAEQLQRVLSNEKYQDLNSRPTDSLSSEEKVLLEAFNKEISDVKAKLNGLGPSGMDFANLEIERANLAKASQEFQKSFKTKFPGAKILGVMAGMFGSKWSALEAGEKTKDAKAKMDDIQIKYDGIRRNLMNTLVDEEHSVRKAFGQDLKNLSQEEKNKLESWISNLNLNFVKKEHEKLDDLKHVLEGTVRGSAMRRFGNWYSKDFMNFGPLKDNVPARNVVKRIVSAGILSAALWPISGAGAVGFLGYRMLRAGIGGIAGESSAAVIARVRGGKMNKKGEFVKFADKRDKELEISNQKFVNEMIERFTKEEKPEVTPSLLEDLKKDHKIAVGNYMNRQGNLRRAEMWARIIAGGATSYGLSQMMVSPEIPVSTVKPVIHPHLPNPPSGPAPDDFKLEGDFVDASSKGAIQTFMNLKKEMLAHYKGTDDGIQYGEADEFKDLSDDKIVEKLLATGKFDDLTSDIMSAKSLPEFMKVAEDHGFWDPEGWGNGKIDSASVPEGSIVGMEINTDGNMQFYMELPNGKHIPITDDFSEALEQELKGVDFINTDKGRYGGGGRPDPDMSLDEGDHAPGRDFEQGDSGSSGRPFIREGVEGSSAENPTNVADIDKLILRYKEIQNPGSEHEFYLRKGFNEHGKQGTQRGTVDDVSTEYFDDAGNFYYTEKAAVYEKFRGGPHDIKNSSMYQEYHMLKTKYDIAQQDIIRLERLKLEQIRMEAETMYEQGQMGPNGPTPEEIAAYEKAVDAKAEELSTKWIDEEFAKDPLFGKPVPGEETKAWGRFKDDKVFDHIKNPEDYDDTFYDPNDKERVRFKGTNKEEDFLESLFARMSRYKIKAGANETITQLVDRVAEVEARNIIKK